MSAPGKSDREVVEHWMEIALQGQLLILALLDGRLGHRAAIHEGLLLGMQERRLRVTYDPSTRQFELSSCSVADNPDAANEREMTERTAVMVSGILRPWEGHCCAQCVHDREDCMEGRGVHFCIEFDANGRGQRPACRSFMARKRRVVVLEMPDGTKPKEETP
jgi:hypothetical protein